MVPAFGLVEAKGLYPCFVRCSNSVSQCTIPPMTDAQAELLVANSSLINGTRLSPAQERDKLRLSTYLLGSVKQC